jgi:hypothetical protein
MSFGNKLQFADYEFEKYGYMPPPEPSVCGGLFTGEDFPKDAPHRNFPLTPDTVVYLQQGLSIGNNVPEKAMYMLPPTREGNSFVDWSSLQSYEGTAINHGPYNTYCAPITCKEKQCYCDEVLCKEDANRYCNAENCINKTENTEFVKYFYYTN